jgi:uncharacterized SAM-binding protein YcdF (DUF218 family)
MVTLALVVAAVVLGYGLAGNRSSWPRATFAFGWLGVAVLLALAAAFSPGPYELRKFVSYCLMPTGVVWLGLLGLALALRRARQPRFAAAAFALWVAYTLAGNVWLGNAMIGWLQRGYETGGPAAPEPFDAVLVLGGAMDVSDDGLPRFAEGGDRVVHAVRVYRAGRARLLLASGPPVRLADGRLTSYPAATEAIWEQLGIPAGSILQVVGPKTTTDEVVALKKLVGERGWRRVGLITSAWHMPRAMRLCRRYGVDATPLPADVRGSEEAKLRYLVPQWLGIEQVQLASWEILGMAAGR